MDTPKPKKKIGRPRKYSDLGQGAPLLASRVDPDVHEWATTRPEGTRPFLERIIREDKRKATSAAAPAASVGPKDVPGQTLIPEVLASTGIVSETESASKKRTRKP